jgi:hypothetical protein
VHTLRSQRKLAHAVVASASIQLDPVTAIGRLRASKNEVLNLRTGRLLAFGVFVAIACITPPRVGAATQDEGVTWLIFVDDLQRL